MNTGLQLQFRGTTEEAARRLSPETVNFAPRLSNNGSGKTCSATVFMDKDDAEDVVAWGSEMHPTGSILSSGRFYDHLEFDSLKSLYSVELFKGFYKDRRDVYNVEQAMDIVWACGNCSRVTVTQIGDLHVDIELGTDLQLTLTHHWIASRRAQEVLRQHGVQFRPLIGTTEYAQVLVRETCTVEPNIFPMQRLNDACPGCGQQSISRYDLVDGHTFDRSFQGATIYRENAVTLVTGSTIEALGISNINAHIADISNPPRHNVGERINGRSIYPLYFAIQPMYFTRARIVADLLKANITGFSFRPAYILSDQAETLSMVGSGKVPSCGPEYDKVLDTARQNVQRINAKNANKWRMNKHETYAIDQKTGLLRFFFKDGTTVTAKFQAIGSFRSMDMSWEWAWNNPNINPSLKLDAFKVFEYGNSCVFKLLCDPIIPLSMDVAWQLTGMASILSDAEGTFCAESQGHSFFMTFHNVVVTKGS